MKAPVLVSVVVLLHVAAVGMLVFVQGCGTTQPSVEPPPAPVLPPTPVLPVDPAVRPLAPAQPELPPHQPPSRTEVPEIGSYRVQNGDSLERIARRFGLGARELAELNNIKDVNRIRIGQILLIPGHSGVAEPAPKPAAPKPPSPRAEPKPSVPLTAGGEYVVQSGDYLGKIASKHGVKIRDLREINQLKNDLIRPGQKLVIPAGGKPSAAEPAPAPAPAPVPPAPAPTPDAPVVEPAPVAPVAPAVTAPPAPAPAPNLTAARMVDYPVTRGETLDSIAKAFLVSPDSIRSVNNLAPGEEPAEGRTIRIPIAD